MDDLPEILETPETIVPIRTTGSRAPLLCIHPVSGSAYPYLVLADRLHPEQPIYGFEAPGYDDDRPPLTSLPEMSAYYVSLMHALWPDTQCCLLGWSLGGVVAFDMARRLTADGVRVPRVIMVDTKVPVRAPLPTEKSMEHKFMYDLMALADTAAPELDAVFARLPDDADPAATFAVIEGSNVLPPEVDAELLHHRYRIYRTHVAAIHDFEIHEVYAGLVTSIRASGTDPQYLQWGPLTSDLQEHTVTGDHHSIWTGAGLAQLTDIVARSLDETERHKTELGGLA